MHSNGQNRKEKKVCGKSDRGHHSTYLAINFSLPSYVYGTEKKVSRYVIYSQLKWPVSIYVSTYLKG